MKKNKSKANYDFSGYATKVGLKCSDGRTIMQDAFADCDGKVVPLVYQHLHNDPKNILGHALLKNKKDGVYAYCSLNDTDSGKTAKALVKHGDITALSIYANSLVQKSANVVHGVIREVSLVIAGANPEAYIDNLAFEHSDGTIATEDSEAIICAGAFSGDDIMLSHSDESNDDDDDNDDDDNDDDPSLSHADTKDETIGDVFESMDKKQKTAVYAMIAHALQAGEANEDDDDDVTHSNIKGDRIMKKNIFENTDQNQDVTHGSLTREGLRDIFNDARQSQSSLKNAFLAHGYATIGEAFSQYAHKDDVLAHAGTYGINNIGYLFPDARTSSNTPAFIKRDTEWVTKVFNAAKHTPFARIKTILADIMADEARARGYITGKKKVDEVITLLKRTTEPQTVYKKQKLDRDDIIDVTDFDIVIWLRQEMRMMLEEELARALLIGDGRLPSSDDKIKEDKIRPIATDDELYTIKEVLAPTITTSEMIDAIVLGRKKYKGSGTPTFFTTPDISGDMLLLKDLNKRRIYNNETDLAAGLRAKEIVEVPVMENFVKVITPATKTEDGLRERLIGISVNMSDYSLGADKGGDIAMFDDFDIDFNQYKYLIETRCSGALTMPHSAIAYWKQEVIPKTGD